MWHAKEVKTFCMLNYHIKKILQLNYLNYHKMLITNWHLPALQKLIKF